MNDLNRVHEELKGEIMPFLKLYRSARAAGMSEEHAVNVLGLAIDDAAFSHSSALSSSPLLSSSADKQQQQSSSPGY
jgi:hypothetical protein